MFLTEYSPRTRINREYSPKDNSPRIIENFLRNENLNLPEHFKAMKGILRPNEVLEGPLDFKVSICPYLTCTAEFLMF